MLPLISSSLPRISSPIVTKPIMAPHLTPRSEPTIIRVENGKRYAAGIVLIDTVARMLETFAEKDSNGDMVLPDLDAAGLSGWKNVTVYTRASSPINHDAGAYTHVGIATRSGQTADIDLSKPPYSGVVEWMELADPPWAQVGQQVNDAASQGGANAVMGGEGGPSTTTILVVAGIALGAFLLLK